MQFARESSKRNCLRKNLIWKLEYVEMASDVNVDVTKWTGARQTMSSWSRVIESFESMPEVFKEPCQMMLGETASFPYTVFAPPIAGLRRKVTEKILCETEDSICVWEHAGNQVRMTEYPIMSISDIEIGRILLYSWFTIGGVTKTGAATSTTIEFSSASSRHFTRFINRMRPKLLHAGERELGMEKAKFDYLATENFKFMNFAIESLVNGEKVLQILWQPKISRPLVSIGRHVLYRATVSVAHLLVLTDKEIILIKDDERSIDKRGVKYGGIWGYVPLKNVHGISLSDREDDLLGLSLTLSPGQRKLDILFEASRRREIVEFQSELEKMIS